ncbi:SDR family oxidoreductase [Scytonema sp. UIC 10036]|nr:SDR family oxidoreductase [Scytonema sp. UIC 10036]
MLYESKKVYLSLKDKVAVITGGGSGIGVIQAEEVAALAVYLASDSAKMITGQIFTIDGGQQAGLY